MQNMQYWYVQLHSLVSQFTDALHADHSNWSLAIINFACLNTSSSVRINPNARTIKGGRWVRLGIKGVFK